MIDGQSYTAERLSGVDMGEGKFSWVGRLAGTRPGYVSLGKTEESISLTVSFSGGSSYSYRGDLENFSWQEKTSRGKRCSDCSKSWTSIQTPDQWHSPRPHGKAGTATLLIWLLYIPKQFGLRLVPPTRCRPIFLLQSEIRIYFRNSQLNLIARVVHMEEISYTPTGLLSTDLDRLIDKSDGYLDSVHSFLDQYGGDIVILLTTESDGGGLASTMSYPHHDFEELAFNVTVWDQMGAPEYTLTHEIGHNMGCLHNIEDVQNITEYFILSEFSHGKRWIKDSIGYRTVMSYDTDPATYPQMVPFFSNPDISYQGEVTGTDTSDNAKTLSITAPYVANFRTSIVQGIVSTNYDVDVTEGNLSSSFGIRLAVKPTESTTVTLSISGDSDLFVGSSQTLTFDDTNWNLPQTVQVLARADTDTDSGTES